MHGEEGHGTPSEETPLIEVHAGSEGQRLSFQLRADREATRRLTGYAAWVTFWYDGAAAPHVVRAALVDAENGAINYELRGDEFPRPGAAFVQITVMSPELGFHQHSGEIIAVKVLPKPPRERQLEPSPRPSDLRFNDRVHMVMPETIGFSINVSTGEVSPVGPRPDLLGAYTFLERSSPGQAWGDLFRSAAQRMGLPWNAETMMAMVTVLSQSAWERVDPREQRPYVAGSIRAESARSQKRTKIRERIHREREPRWQDTQAGAVKPRPIEEAVSHDPRVDPATLDWAAHLARCAEVLAGINDWNERQEKLLGVLIRSAKEDKEISVVEAGRSQGWTHEETMSIWQSLQRKAQRARDREEEEEK